MLTLPMPAGICYKTVSSALIRLFLRQAQHYGLDEQAFCALTGITHADLHAHDGRLSGDKHLRMLLWISNTMNE